MGKPRVNLPTLVRSQPTTTCIDTTNVSRNPNIVPHQFQFPCGAISDGNLTFYRYSYSIPASGQTFSTPFPSSSNSINVKTVSGDDPLWRALTSQRKVSPPTISQKERIALFERATQEEQDALVDGEITIYELKAKYDALDENSESDSTTEDSLQQHQVQDEISTPIPEEPIDLVLHIEEESSDLTSYEECSDIDVQQNANTQQQRSSTPEAVCETVTTLPSVNDIPLSFNIKDEREFEPAITNSMACDRPLGSRLSIVQRGFGDVIHYHSSLEEYGYDEQEQVAIEVLYNFKKRRRKQVN